MRRRRFLQTIAAGGGAAALLAACGSGDDDNAPASQNNGTARSKRELRVATNVFPVSLDPDVGFASFALMGVGAGEALMRVTPEMKIVPWLAEKLTQVNETTWRVTVRNDATFWDGSKVDAEAVKASFERTMEKQGGAVSFALPAGTRFAANGQDLDIITPVSIGAMASNLAIFYLIVKKARPGGTAAMTGPYMTDTYVEQQSLTLKAYEKHRDGPARTPVVQLRRVADTNSRLLAIQAGDADLAFAMLPGHVPALKSSGAKVESFLFGRLNGIILNNRRAPLDDVLVRRAVSLAIDRNAIVNSAMEKEGKPAYGIVAKDWGIDSAVETQRSDRDAANRALDEAGWTRGSDGLRTKGGRRLTFTLGFYKTRPELEPTAIIVRDQLKQAGIEVALQEILDINQAVAESNFDATIYSYTVTPSGDINRGLAQLFIPGGTNKDRYSNPRVNSLYDEYNRTAEPGRRAALSREIQQLIGEDVPVVYLAFPNQIVAMSSKVSGYTPHLLENYQIDGRIYVAD